MKCIKK